MRVTVIVYWTTGMPVASGEAVHVNGFFTLGALVVFANRVKMDVDVAGIGDCNLEDLHRLVATPAIQFMNGATHRALIRITESTFGAREAKG